MWRSVTKAIRDWRRSMAASGSSYRPDLYYMRGPGPKWHAKYGHLAPKPASRSGRNGAALRQAEHRV